MAGQVIRDQEMMQKYASLGNEQDPFLVTTARPMERKLLEDANFARNRADQDCQEQLRIRRMNRGSPGIRFLRRLLMFILLIAALLAPLLIGIFAPGYIGRVIIMCVCIVLFTAATIMMRGSKDALLPSVALVLIYCATVVIFVSGDPIRRAGSR